MKPLESRSCKQKHEPMVFMTRTIVFLFVLLLSIKAFAFEIVIKLTGHEEFPGLISVDAGAGKKFDRLCLLGQEAYGSIDLNFIMALAKQGVPQGNYKISSAFPEEQWPTSSFSANGALRLLPQTKSAQKFLRKLGKKGLALHAKDFYPLAGKMTTNPKMVQFFSDQLFERLAKRWGTLRISNWDMGRFHDFYRRNTKSDKQWEVQVQGSILEQVKNICAPLKVQRKPDGPLE